MPRQGLVVLRCTLAVDRLPNGGRISRTWLRRMRGGPENLSARR